MGEAPGFDEAMVGRPFIGAAGSMFERILRRNRLNRAEFRIGNTINCVPPNLSFEGMPWQHAALQHCSIHRSKLLAEPHQVVMAAGATALKTLLGLHGAARIRVEEFHGTVHRDLEDRYWVVPTFHPSFLQRGASNLIGTVSFDIQVALELARGQWQLDPIDLVIDPPPDWWDAWVEMVCVAALQDPEGVALACDLETPDKAGGKPENELTPDDDSYQILRWNFAVTGEQGVTIPNDPRYQAGIRRLLALPCRHYWWNGYGYDWARIWAAGYSMEAAWQLDQMLGAHAPERRALLGFGRPHSRIKPEDFMTDPRSCQIDGPQTFRCDLGT
jgi:uracil-DNA glycosylase family 4